MNIKIEIEYDGTEYVGWQRQLEGKSIQGEIENCLEKIFKKKITIFVAGRTDAGVHALGQVAHFEIENCNIDPSKLYLAINSHLIKSQNQIVVKSSRKKSKNFHARFSAKKRIYEYKIFNKQVISPFINKRMWFVPHKLDISLIKKASLNLIGSHDFNAFRSSGCQATSAYRSIESVCVKKKSFGVVITFKAKSFLHNQVRIMVGTLVNIGRNFWDVNRIKFILDSKDRKNAGKTAPPHGLYLKKVTY